MKLVTYQINKHAKLGALIDYRVVDLQSAHQKLTGIAEDPLLSDTTALLAAGEATLARISDLVDRARADLAAVSQPVAAVTLLPPVLKPTMVIAVGRNYAAHAQEGGTKPPKYPELFHKTAGSLIGAGQPVVIPPLTNEVDFEGELAVIIGRTCKNVSTEEALAYVAGYTIANDVSARDVQRRTTQFTAGKMLDTFGPLGPALVTRDEIPDPGNLAIQTRLNGRVMQDSNTNHMIFAAPFIISYISQLATLHVGDVILTGTPEGVGFARTPPIFMQAGDEISVEIEGLGVLTNPVVSAG